MSKLIDVLSDSGLRTGEVLPRAEIHLSRLVCWTHLQRLPPFYMEGRSG